MSFPKDQQQPVPDLWTAERSSLEDDAKRLQDAFAVPVASSPRISAKREVDHGRHVFTRSARLNYKEREPRVRPWAAASPPSVRVALSFIRCRQRSFSCADGVVPVVPDIPAVLDSRAAPERRTGTSRKSRPTGRNGGRPPARSEPQFDCGHRRSTRARRAHRLGAPARGNR
jgi:hypothetical protein